MREGRESDEELILSGLTDAYEWMSDGYRKLNGLHSTMQGPNAFALAQFPTLCSLTDRTPSHMTPFLPISDHRCIDPGFAQTTSFFCSFECDACIERLLTHLDPLERRDCALVPAIEHTRVFDFDIPTR